MNAEEVATTTVMRRDRGAAGRMAMMTAEGRARRMARRTRTVRKR